MNSNKINEIIVALRSLKDEKETFKFLSEILTEAEMIVLSKRWRIMEMLEEGFTQRDIARELNVSLCKVTRGAKILKSPQSIVKKCLDKKG